MLGLEVGSQKGMGLLVPNINSPLFGGGTFKTMNKPINNHPMQIREDLQKEEMPPVWDTRTGECFYINHTPTLDVEYIWSPDDGGKLNDEGANTILKIRCGTGVHSRTGNYNHPKNLEEDLLVLAISIDWEDKEPKSPSSEGHPKQKGYKMKYQVGIKIYNCFTVEADSEQEAEEKVRDFSVHETLDDCDYNISYVLEEDTK